MILGAFIAAAIARSRSSSSCRSRGGGEKIQSFFKCLTQFLGRSLKRIETSSFSSRISLSPDFTLHRRLMPSQSVLTIFLLIGGVTVLGAKSEPPVTYDCEDEGFFPHPKDCKKYFWCLDSGPANLGIVPHHFTCPSGLYFNTKTEACDYPSNVPCASEKKNKTLLTRSRGRKKSTTEAPVDAIDDEIVLTTLSPGGEITTLPPITTTASTTTTAPTTKAPSRLLKEAGVGQRQRRPVQPSSSPSTTLSPSSQQDDDLTQLLHLVQSLGGVERIKTLVSDKDTSVNNEITSSERERSGNRVRSNSRQQQTTPASFFSPSYETPRRQEAVTETPPNLLAANPSNHQVRHRRPQFDHSQPPSSESPPVTVNPFLSYADPSRGTSFDSDPVTDAPLLDFRDNRNDFPRDSNSLSTGSNTGGQSERLQSPPASNYYSFSYNTPGSRVSVQSENGLQASRDLGPANPASQNRPQSISLPVNSPFNDPFFAYNTPGRYSAPATHAVETTASFTTVTEPTTSAAAEVPAPQNPGRGSSRQRQSGRSDGGFVRVRVNPGGNLRFSEPGAHQGSSGRRATRVRVANPSRINPGNLLNQPLTPAVLPRNPRIHHNGNSQSGSSPPSVHYDEDRELHHIHSEVARTEIPIEIVTTRRPARRRPPQREHLRNRQEDNPVGALVNLPPPNLQFDPSQSFPAASGHGSGNGRPFPPRPQTLPPLPFSGTTRSLPRILPIAVPLVTLAPRPNIPEPDSPANDRPSTSFESSVSHDASDGFRPGTVRYSNLNIPANFPSSPRPQFDDLFVTDFPFFADNPSSPQQPATQATTTTTTTTTTPPPPSPVTTEYEVAPPTRRQRQRQRQRQRRPTAATLPSFEVSETPRPTRRREVTTVPPPVPSRGEGEGTVPSGPPVEMESGLVKCTRRGVFAHPGSCGQFVVCAPASRGSLSYRSYMHHCPAEQVFVEEVGRCRPGNKEKCEVFTR